MLLVSSGSTEHSGLRDGELGNIKCREEQLGTELTGKRSGQWEALTCTHQMRSEGTSRGCPGRSASTTQHPQQRRAWPSSQACPVAQQPAAGELSLPRTVPLSFCSRLWNPPYTQACQQADGTPPLSANQRLLGRVWMGPADAGSQPDLGLSARKNVLDTLTGLSL